MSLFCFCITSSNVSHSKSVLGQSARNSCWNRWTSESIRYFFAIRSGPAIIKGKSGWYFLNTRVLSVGRWSVISKEGHNQQCKELTRGCTRSSARQQYQQRHPRDVQVERPCIFQLRQGWLAWTCPWRQANDEIGGSDGHEKPVYGGRERLLRRQCLHLKNIDLGVRWWDWTVLAPWSVTRKQKCGRHEPWRRFNRHCGLAGSRSLVLLLFESSFHPLTFKMAPCKIAF